MKTCSACGEEKPLTDFNRRARSKDGLISKCRSCQSVYKRSWYLANRADQIRKSREYHQANLDERRERMRRRRLEREYDMTPAAYQELLDAQGGVCLICSGTGGMAHMLAPLVVDHAHDETGRIRGLLCAGCNVGLGAFGDDPDRLIAAAAYLLRNENVLGMVNR